MNTDSEDFPKSGKSGEENYKLLFSNMINAFALHKIIVDKKGQPLDYEFIEVNSSFEKMTGLKRSDILGKTVKIVIPGIEKDSADWIGKYGEVALTGKAIQLENYSEGLKKWFNITAYSPREGYFATIFEDITERKLAQDTINHSQKLLQRVIDLLPIRVFWKDKNLKYLGCNEVFAHDAGKDFSEELIGKDDFEMKWKDQAELYRQDDQSVIRSGQSKINFEEPQTTPNGDKIWLKTSKVPLTDLHGNIMGVLGTYEDITERKLAIEKVKKEQAITNTIIDSIPGAFYMFDKNGFYVRWNSFQRDEIVGKSDELMSGVKAIDTIHPDDREFVSSKIVSVLKNGGSETVEGRVLTHGGPDFKWFLMTGRPVIIDGSPFLIGIGIDITERKRVAEEIKKSKDALQLKVDELEKFNKLTVSRELKMIELKGKIKELEEKLSKN